MHYTPPENSSVNFLGSHPLKNRLSFRHEATTLELLNARVLHQVSVYSAFNRLLLIYIWPIRCKLVLPFILLQQ